MGKAGVMESIVLMMENSSYGMTLIVQPPSLQPSQQPCPKGVTMKANGAPLASLKIQMSVGVGMEHSVVWMAS